MFMYKSIGALIYSDFLKINIKVYYAKIINVHIYENNQFFNYECTYTIFNNNLLKYNEQKNMVSLNICII